MTTAKDPEQISVHEAISFWSRVTHSKSCWHWMGAQRSGYGVVKIAGAMRTAHRIAWMLLRGNIPAGKYLDHLCRIRNCVNPAHLEVVEHRTNTLRGFGPTAKYARQVLCKRGHNLAGAYTGMGRRDCRICHREAQRRYVARSAA